MSKLHPTLSSVINRVGGFYIAVVPHGSDCVYIDGLHCVGLDTPELECITRDMGCRDTSNRVFRASHAPRGHDVYRIHEIPSPRHTIRVYGYTDYLVSSEARRELQDMGPAILEAFGLRP